MNFLRKKKKMKLLIGMVFLLNVGLCLEVSIKKADALAAYSGFADYENYKKIENNIENSFYEGTGKHNNLIMKPDVEKLEPLCEKIKEIKSKEYKTELVKKIVYKILGVVEKDEEWSCSIMFMPDVAWSFLEKTLDIKGIDYDDIYGKIVSGEGNTLFLEMVCCRAYPEDFESYPSYISFLCKLTAELGKDENKNVKDILKNKNSVLDPRGQGSPEHCIRNTPLVMAIKETHEELACELVKHYNKEDLLVKTATDNTALHLAAFTRQNKIIKAILKRLDELDRLKPGVKEKVLSEKNEKGWTVYDLYKATYEAPTSLQQIKDEDRMVRIPDEKKDKNEIDRSKKYIVWYSKKQNATNALGESLVFDELIFCKTSPNNEALFLFFNKGKDCRRLQNMSTEETFETIKEVYTHYKYLSSPEDIGHFAVEDINKEELRKSRFNENVLASLMVSSDS